MPSLAIAAIGRGELDRRHPELVAHREAGPGVHRLPSVGPGQPAARLGGKLRTGGRAEAEVPQHLELLLGREPGGELRHGDVAGHLDGLRQRQVAGASRARR